MHPNQRASQWQAQRKALGIRRRVGASGDALDGSFPPKPRKSFLRTAAQAHLTSVILSQGDPLRMRVERRLPALYAGTCRPTGDEIGIEAEGVK